MIYLIGKKFDSKNNGLYIDDRLDAFKNVSRPASDKILQLQTITIFAWEKRHANNYTV